MTAAIKSRLFVSVPSGNIDYITDRRAVCRGPRSGQGQTLSLTAPCTQNLQFSLGRLSNRSARQCRYASWGSPVLNAIPCWRRALGRAKREPRAGTPFGSLSWVIVQLMGKDREGHTHALLPHNVSITALGGFGYGRQQRLESQAGSGIQEIHGRFQQRLNHILCSSCCPVNADCIVTTSLCPSCASEVRASAGTQGHVQVGCAKLMKGSGCLVSITSLSVVSEKVFLSQKEASVLARCSQKFLNKNK